MKCEKLRRIYFKYMDGELSEWKAGLVEKHVRDCPDCAIEAESLKKMRSLLRAACDVERPDTYWDTYWERLEKKLPGEPSPVTLTSRISSAFISMFRRPAVLGRIAIYVLFLAILAYMIPDHPHPFRGDFEMAQKVTTGVPESLKVAESKIALRDNVKDAEVADVIAPERGTRLRGRVSAGPAEQQAEVAGLPVESEADKEQIGTKLGVSATKTETAKTEETAGEAFAWAAPAKPVSAPEEPLDKSSAEVRDQPQYAVKNEEEYMAADNYFKKAEYPRAIASYQNFIVANQRVDMDDERMLRAVYQLGEANYQIGNYSEALSNFVAVTNEKMPEALDVESDHLMSGTRARRMVVSESAVREELKEAKSDLKPERDAAGRKAIALYYDRRLDEELPKTREEMISRAVLRQAESYEHLGELKEALSKYREYLETYPKGRYAPQAREKIAQMAR